MRIKEILTEKKNKHQPQISAAAAVSVQPKLSDMRMYKPFNKDFASYTRNNSGLANQIKQRLSYIFKIKSIDPSASVGGNDSPLKGVLAGFWHCHLTRSPDLSLIYRIKGGILHLHAIAQHDDYTTDGAKKNALAARLRNSLLESVYFDAPDMNDDGTFPIYSLNNATDLKIALRKSKSNGELRGLIADDLVLAWDSFEDVHAGVIEHLESYDAEYGEEINADWEAKVYFYTDHVAMAPKRRGDPNYVLNHPFIKKIYGNNVRLGSVREGTE